MQKTCRQCDSQFEITEQDIAFLDKIATVIDGKKIQIPPPTLCPDCRQQRRLAQTNQLHLYKRKCDLTGKDLISNYHPSLPHKVYNQEDWHGDKWDARIYGQAYDFNKTFFEQFKELSLKVPRPNLQTSFMLDENSHYTNYAGKNRDCYFIFDSDENWDCYYSYSINKSKDCIDNYRVRRCELCSECIDSIKCYNCHYCQNSEDCSDSYFVRNCIGCHNCIFCVNLRNKTHYIANKQVTKEEYEKALEKLKSYKEIQKTFEEFKKYQLKFPRKFIQGSHNENCLGEYLDHSKNAEECYDSSDLWDCKYVHQAFNPLKDSMDIQECGDAELLYECSCVGYKAFNIKFTTHTLESISDTEYCYLCPHSSHLFGCVGLQRNKYCILNKQYEEAEYNALVPKIIAHMKETGEYGEFFPISLSPFAYNETIAQDHYPLTKEEALKRGYRWHDETPPTFENITKTLDASRLPDTLEKTPDEILNWAIKCEKRGKLFQIQKAELALYRKMNKPIPHAHFLERHASRQALRNPQKLWDRQCAKCNAPIRTSYASDRPDIVYCEKCYLESVN